MNTRFSKSILVLAIVSLLGTGAALAGNGNGNGDGTGQGGGNRGGGNMNAEGDFGGGPAGRMARISERLGLSTEQQHQLLDLFEAHQQERDDIRAQIVHQFGDAVCTQRRLHQEEFLGILTPAQLAEHEAMMAQRGERQGNRKGRGEGGFNCAAEETGDS